MRKSLIFVVFGMIGCVDWNRGPELEDLVDAFVQDQQLTDLVDCEGIDTQTCDSGETADVERFDEGRQCLAEAFEACTPAKLQVISTDGDGNETREVFVVHPVGDTCAVERFVDSPEGGKRVLAEQSCENVTVAPDAACEGPQADTCEDVCGGDKDDCWW